MAEVEDNEREPPAARPEPRRDGATQSRRQARVALGLDECPDCGSIHPSRWARWQAVGTVRPGDVVAPVCPARSPLMLNVYGSTWRVLAVDSTSKHSFPKLLVEALEPGPWLREDEEARAEVDGRDVFPVAETGPGPA